MADDTGLMGMSSPDIDALLKQYLAAAQQMGPPDSDKTTAKNHALLTAGLGMLGSSYMPPAMAVGRGGLLGVGSYNDELSRLAQQRSQALQSTQGLIGLANTMRMQNIGLGMLNDDGSGSGAPGGAPGAPVPGTGTPTMAPASFDTQGMTPGGAAGAFAAGGQQPSPAAPINPPQYAPGGNPFPNWRQVAPKAELGAAIASGDWKKVADVVSNSSKLTVGKNGELTMGNMLVGRAQGEGTIIYPQGDVSRAYYIGSPPEALAASVKQAGSMEGAKAAATEAAQFPYRTTTVQTPSGPQSGYMSSLYGPPQLPQIGGPAPQGAPGPMTANQAPQMNSLAALIAADKAGQPGTFSPQGNMPAPNVPSAPSGVIAGPNPVTQAQAMAAAAERGKQQAEQEQAAHTAGAGASMEDARLDEMNNLLPYFKPGATLPMRSKIAAPLLDVPFVGSSLANLAVDNAKVAVPAIESFTKIGTTMVADMSKSMGSREAAQIVTMLQGAFPNVGQVDGAPQTIIQFMRGLNRYKADSEQAMSDWRNNHQDSNGQPTLDGFQEAWHKSNPVSKYVPPLSQLQSIASGQSPASAASAPTGNLAPANADQLKAALGAIKQGADRDAVKQRMIQNGISPAGL